MLHVHLRNALQALHEAPEFGGQDVHNAVPVVSLYVPVMHAVHAPPFGP